MPKSIFRKKVFQIVHFQQIKIYQKMCFHQINKRLTIGIESTKWRLKIRLSGSTVWKFKNFYVTNILREITFAKIHQNQESLKSSSISRKIWKSGTFCKNSTLWVENLSIFRHPKYFYCIPYNLFGSLNAFLGNFSKTFKWEKNHFGKHTP